MKPSKKTIITPNRFTTFIQSWWAKAPMLFVFALFFSCEEDFNQLGLRGDDQRLKTYYAEIPVPSSVLLLDSVRSMNYASTETNRLLIGSYQDPLMGTVQAKAFTQYRATDVVTALPAGAVYDSVVLQLRFDYYNYGTDGITPFELAVHELTDPLSLSNLYYSNSEAAYDPTPLGTIATTVDQVFFDKQLASTDSLLVMKIKLDNSFGQRLFGAIDPEDQDFSNFNLFKNHFKGLALVPTVSDKVVGISQANNSFLTVYYSTDTIVLSRSFVLNSGISFSNITSDRSGTELSGLINHNEEYTATTNRYVQSGVGIATKLDFSGFYDLIDNHPNVVIVSAELAIDNVSPPGALEYPTLGLVMLDENNRYKKFKSEQDTTDYISFSNKVLIGSLASNDAVVSPYVASDLSNGLSQLAYLSSDNKFASYPTLFFQQLYTLREKRYKDWAFVAVTPTPAKSVNRVVFPKDNIKLKIFYTRPNTEN